MGKDRTQPASDQEIIDHILAAVKPFLLKNGLHIALAVLVVVVAVVLFRTRGYRHERWTNDGWDAVAAVPDSAFLFIYQPEQTDVLRRTAIEQCRLILEEGPETGATPWLLLKIANLHASGEEWSAAIETYNRLIGQYGDSLAADMAREGLGVALEEAGRYDEAAKVYETLAEGGTQRYLLHAGRSRELAGQVPAAEADYRRMLDGDVAGELQSVAKARLAELAAGHALRPPPEPRPPSPVETEPPAGAPGAEPLAVPKDTPETVDAAEAPARESQKQPQTDPEPDEG